jgi:hypothetical protein
MIPYSATLEIIEIADTIDLTVLETAKQELGIAAEDTSQDAKIARWIHEVSGQVNARVDRVLGRERVKETFELDWAGNLGPLPLRRYPVAQVDSVTEHGVALATDQYRVDGAKGLLYRNFGRWCGEVIVTYQAGYQLLGELPYDLEFAALLLLQYRNSGARDPSLRSESVPGVYEATYWVGSTPGAGGSLPSNVAELLAPYIDTAI